MSRIADEHYIKGREREQALEFMEYIVACAANYFQRKHGPLPKPVDAVATPSRKRNSPRKWMEHHVHGTTFAEMNRQMTTIRSTLKTLEYLQAQLPWQTREAEIEMQKKLLSNLHREYDSLRKSIVASESSN